MLLSQIMQVKTRKPGGQECGPNIRKRTRGMRINDVWPDGLMNLMIVATHSRRFRVPFPSVTSQRGECRGLGEVCSGPLAIVGRLEDFPGKR